MYNEFKGKVIIKYMTTSVKNQNSKVKMRNSNFELMRIVSMFFIVIYHIIIHGKLLENSHGTTHFVLYIILATCIVHVNSFILVTGYFQCKSKLKFTKVIQLNNSIWFYTVSIVLFFIIVKGNTFISTELLKTFLPISYNDYWFLTNYLILYLISPILNTVINNIDEKKFKRIIVLLLFIDSILPTLTNSSFFNVTLGYSLYHFIFLYFVGAFLRNYPIEDWYIFKKTSKKALQLISLFIFFLMAFINIINQSASKELLNMHPIIAEVGIIFSNSFIAYNNPLVIIQTIAFFVFFSTLNLKSTFINYISTATIGIYLIHDNNNIRNVLYKFLGFNRNNYSVMILGKILGCAILIFISCLIIELIRKFIFKLIYNTKIAKKNREWYRNYINSLGFDINW